VTARKGLGYLATTIQDEGGSFSVSFVPRSAGARYLAMTSGAAVTDLSVWVDTPSTLASKNNAADYIIIAPDELMDAAQDLADYRQGQGYQTMVVNLEDIMDEFNYGISSPRHSRLPDLRPYNGLNPRGM
jgi:hypothetical protein